MKKAPTLTALHISDGSARSAAAKRDVDHELEILRRVAGDWADVEVRGITIPAEDAVSAIAAQAASIEAELVVLGTRGANPQSEGALGSVSAAVLGAVRAPVLLVPPALWRDYAGDLSDD